MTAISVLKRWDLEYATNKFPPGMLNQFTDTHHYVQNGEDGRFRRIGLRAGKYRIQLFGHKESEEIVEVGVDETRQVEFHVPRKE